MVLEGTKMHEVSIQQKCRQTILDRLLRVGCGRLNDRSHSFQHVLNRFGKSCDVPVDTFRRRRIHFHGDTHCLTTRSSAD